MSLGSTSNFNKSDLQRIYGIQQNTMIKYPKELFIHVLRDFFSQDTYYRYLKDEFGFANIQGQKDFPLDAGEHDDLTTRLYIGEPFKNREKIYPSIIIKSNSVKDVPYSATNEEGSIQNLKIMYIDQNTNQRATATIPQYFLLAGSWEGSFSIEVAARNTNVRDELIELIAMYYKKNMQEFINNGLILKPLSISGPSEAQDRNDFIHRQTITADYKGEWRIETPIYSLIERIVITVDFGNLNLTNPTFSKNLQIKTDLDVTDFIINNVYPNSI